MQRNDRSENRPILPLNAGTLSLSDCWAILTGSVALLHFFEETQYIRETLRSPWNINSPGKFPRAEWLLSIVKMSAIEYFLNPRWGSRRWNKSVCMLEELFWFK